MLLEQATVRINTNTCYGIFACCISLTILVLRVPAVYTCS
jgi:hypothetical protein